MTLLFALDSLSSSTAEEVVKLFGGKAAGLLHIPSRWRPETLLVSTVLFEKWQVDRAGFVPWATTQLNAEILYAIGVIGENAILRSSATDETIRERGRFLTRDVELSNDCSNLAEIIDEIFTSYFPHKGKMCLVLQRLISAKEIGFLSNELRLVDKPYRWIAECHIKRDNQNLVDTRPISAKQAKPFATDQPLVCVTKAELLTRLKSVAQHFWKASSQRTLLEWCWDGSRLWIVQRDLALPQTGGRDPSTLKNSWFTVPTATDGETFRNYEVGSYSPWGKLRNVGDFATDGRAPPHRLFFASAERVRAAIGVGTEELVHEINSLTGGRCVLRTDAVEQRFNRRRTNTVDGSGAVGWIRGEIASWQKSETPLQDVAFILHAYIPATAAAWSYYKRNSNFVRIDGLWGLADGMQYYPCDTYICEPETGEQISMTLRFKDLALLEQPDGTWRTERIDPRFARHRALAKAECKDIAVRTAKIANNIGKDVQIMWFVGIPESLKLGHNLPWYEVTPDQSLEERRSKQLSAILVKNIGDLSKLDHVGPSSCKVVLEPVGEDLRSDAFINSVSARCKGLGLPVEVRGSILGHAYHQLLHAGVEVFTAEPSKRRFEVRQRKAFDKLVRDQVPEVIASKGEIVRANELEPDDLRAALVGKLLEEVGEFLTASGKSNAVEELSDILEVVRGLAAAASVSFSDVVQKADEKAQKRGGFLKGVILRSTEASRRANEEPKLFDPAETRRRIRLDSIRPMPGTGADQEVPLSLLMTAGPQDVPLQVDRRHQVTIRVSVMAGTLNIEVRAFQAIDSDQPKFL